MTDATKREAFVRLLRDHLGLSGNDELVTIYDESFAPNLDALLAASNRLNVRLTLINLPSQQQLHLLARLDDETREVRMPRGLVGAMTAAAGILNVVSDSAETTVVRRAIVNQERPVRCRLAHLPGISDPLLDLVLRTNLDQLDSDCEFVARALGNAKEVVVTTRDVRDNIYELHIALRGWENEPIIGSGIIPEGSWGNVPGGETFCCPPSDGVNGRICINGSVPNHVLGQGEEIILEFQNGKLLHWNGNDSSPSKAFLDKEERDAERRADRNWNSFAEFGIGLNPAVAQLTGNELFDEKAAGTIHIAIGDNSCFGHDIAARVHHDMVTSDITVTLDGEPLITRGELCKSRWENHFPAQLPTPFPVIKGQLLYLRRSRFEIRNNCLVRRLSSGHRTGYVRIGSDDTAKRLALLAGELNAYDKVAVTEFLRNYPEFAGVATIELLSILYHYRIVGCR